MEIIVLGVEDGQCSKGRGMFKNEFLLNSGLASTAWPINHTLYQKLQNIVPYYALQKKPDFKLCSPVFISFKR